MTGHTPGRGPSDVPDGVRIRTHPALCIGAGNCHRWAPAVYSLDEDGMIALHLASVPPEQALEAWIGAKVCPERAITVIGPPEEYWIERRDRELAVAATVDGSDAGTGTDEPTTTPNEVEQLP